MHRFAVLVLLMLCPAPPMVLGQPSLAPPLVNRPAQFSGLVGDYAIRATAAPVDVQVEEPITLRITLEAFGEVAAEYQPDPKKLKLFPPGFDEKFFVEERPTEHQLEPVEKRWTFVYRLRPKTLGKQSIEDLSLVYWQPRLKRFQTRYAEPIALQVTARRDTAAVLPAEVILAPASFYELPDESRLLLSRVPPGVPTESAIIIAIMAPLVAVLLGVLAWRRCHPSKAENRRRRRRRVLRDSVDAIRGNSPLWPVLDRYFAENWGYVSEQPTPAEVASYLRRRGLAKPLCDRVESLLRGCDAIRYAPTSPVEFALRTTAIALLQDLENDPCA